DLTAWPVTPEAVMHATDYASPALEIVGSRIANWDIKAVDTIADNASSGLFVLGSERKSLRGLDLAACPMVLECSGALASSGSGAECFGSPLNAAAWLAEKMIEIGRPLKAGDIVMTGALGRMAPVLPGTFFRASIGGLGHASISSALNARERENR